MYLQKFVGMTATTSIHVGASANDAAVDLPIQRESHSDWPVIYGSSMKGALRSHAQQQKSDWVTEVFGPDTQGASDHAGSLLVSDARLLVLPVRSLTSHFKWVTCPAILARLSKDFQRAGIDQIFDLPDFSQEQALVCNEKADGFLFLEEFRYTQKVVDLTSVVNTLAKLINTNEASLKEKLTIVSDDQFRYLSRAATPVNARIAIENETKTVKNGALWYEESLPPETVFYLLLAMGHGRKKQTSNQDLLAECENMLKHHPFVQVGGNLTTGMGWFECKLVEGE